MNTKENIQKFVNQEFGEIRTLILDEEPWFVGKDVAQALGYKKPENAIAAHVDSEDKTTTLIQGTGSNYKSKATIISESGLYALIFGSKLESAKRFKRWVTREVLPQIRKTSAYIPINKDDSDAEIMAKGILAAQRTIEKKDAIIKQQQDKLEELEDNWKTLTDCDGTFTINEVAHFVGIGEYHLFKYLRDMKILFKNDNGDNVPYENPTNKSKFCVVPAISPDGVTHSQTRVYPYGLEYIMMRLRKAGHIFNRKSNEVAYE